MSISGLSDEPIKFSQYALANLAKDLMILSKGSRQNNQNLAVKFLALVDAICQDVSHTPRTGVELVGKNGRGNLYQSSSSIAVGANRRMLLTFIWKRRGRAINLSTLEAVLSTVSIVPSQALKPKK